MTSVPVPLPKNLRKRHTAFAECDIALDRAHLEDGPGAGLISFRDRFDRGAGSPIRADAGNLDVDVGAADEVERGERGRKNVIRQRRVLPFGQGLLLVGIRKRTHRPLGIQLVVIVGLSAGEQARHRTRKLPWCLVADNCPSRRRRCDCISRWPSASIAMAIRVSRNAWESLMHASAVNDVRIGPLALRRYSLGDIVVTVPTRRELQPPKHNACGQQ